MARGLAEALDIAAEHGGAIAALEALGETPRQPEDMRTGVALGEFISATAGSWPEAFALGMLATGGFPSPDPEISARLAALAHDCRHSGF